MQIFGRQVAWSALTCHYQWDFVHELHQQKKKKGFKRGFHDAGQVADRCYQQRRYRPRLWTLCHESLDSSCRCATAITLKPCMVYFSRVSTKLAGTGEKEAGPESHRPCTMTVRVVGTVKACQTCVRLAETRHHLRRPF